MERTLIILKPDAVRRGIVGEIVSRFERAGLKIIGVKMLRPDYDHFHKHYEDISKMISRRGEEPFRRTLEMMQSGPVIAVVLEGLSAVTHVRKMVGDTEPQKAQPGTIRGDYAHMGIPHGDELDLGLPNLIHASGDPKEAKQEIAHWFSDDELFDYQPVHAEYTLGARTKK